MPKCIILRRTITFISGQLCHLKTLLLYLSLENLLLNFDQKCNLLFANSQHIPKYTGHKRNIVHS